MFFVLISSRFPALQDKNVVVRHLLNRFLESVTIDSEFEEFALRVLDELRNEHAAEQQAIEHSQQESLQGIAKQKEALLSLYLAGHLTQDEYAAKKSELTQQEDSLKPKDDTEGGPLAYGLAILQ